MSQSLQASLGLSWLRDLSNSTRLTLQRELMASVGLAVVYGALAPLFCGLVGRKALGLSDIQLAVLTASNINGDGKMDALANSDRSGLFWYEIPDDPSQPWQAHLIMSAAQHKIHGGVSPRAAGDMDGDGDMDVVTGRAWYENQDGKGLRWKQHATIAFGEKHKYGIALKTWIIDMDGDGDMDFVQAEADNPDSRVAWFENDGQAHWTRHLIKPRGDQQDFHSLVVADFDGDGDADVFSGGGPLSAPGRHTCYRGQLDLSELHFRPLCL